MVNKLRHDGDPGLAWPFLDLPCLAWSPGGMSSTKRDSHPAVVSDSPSSGFGCNGWQLALKAVQMAGMYEEHPVIVGEVTGGLSK